MNDGEITISYRLQHSPTVRFTVDFSFSVQKLGMEVKNLAKVLSSSSRSEN